MSAPARKAARNWPYVFVLGAGWVGRVDHAKALDARRWTEVMQAVLKRQAGVGSEFRVYSSFRMMTSPTFTTEPRVWGRVGVEGLIPTKVELHGLWHYSSPLAAHPGPSWPIPPLPPHPPPHPHTHPSP